MKAPLQAMISVKALENTEDGKGSGKPKRSRRALNLGSWTVKTSTEREGKSENR